MYSNNESIHPSTTEKHPKFFLPTGCAWSIGPSAWCEAYARPHERQSLSAAWYCIVLYWNITCPCGMPWRQPSCVSGAVAVDDGIITPAWGSFQFHPSCRDHQKSKKMREKNRIIVWPVDAIATSKTIQTSYRQDYPLNERRYPHVGRSVVRVVSVLLSWIKRSPEVDRSINLGQKEFDPAQ